MSRSLGVRAEIGSLEVGKKADLIVLDARRAHLVPALRIVPGWIDTGQAGDVESVMVDGRCRRRRDERDSAQGSAPVIASRHGDPGDGVAARA